MAPEQYTHRMRDEQRINVEWMRDVMKRHDLNAAQWVRIACEVAEAKGERCTLKPTTVTRAMKDDYKYVTKAITLVQLAAAVGETPPVEPVEEVAEPLIPLPTIEVLEAMLREHHAGTTKGARASQEMISSLARRMHDSLASLQADPVAARVPEAAHSAALQIGRAHDR